MNMTPCTQASALGQADGIRGELLKLEAAQRRGHLCLRSGGGFLEEGGLWSHRTGVRAQGISCGKAAGE